MDKYPCYSVDMKTIQITIDEDLLSGIDKSCGKGSRSAFFRDAAVLFLKEQRKLHLERQDREGYKKKPIKASELGEWEREQVWPEW